MITPNQSFRRRGLGCLAALAVCCLNLPAFGYAARTSSRMIRPPKVFYADPQALAQAKAKFLAGDAALKPAFDRLLREANDSLQFMPRSVMDKRRVPPSGDKHDYVSQAPYFWPDTNSPDGHYVRRDGQRNPESGRDSDAGPFGAVCGRTHTLGLAYFFTGDERYAAQAAKIVRFWFLDPATRMNPNLNFGQGIPGEVDGRPAGLIGARGLVEFVDGLALLAHSRSWTAADQKGMMAWVKEYLTWLKTSKIGKGERDATNNHGTFYDTQLVALELFAGNRKLAYAELTNACVNRIARQIEPDGRMPRELGRTLSFNYSLFNIRAMLDLASLGQNAGVDLWYYRTADGRSIRKALEYVLPYANPTNEWPHQQIHAPNRAGLASLVLRAAPVYPDANFESALKYLRAGDLAASSDRLMFKTARIDADASGPARARRVPANAHTDPE